MNKRRYKILLAAITIAIAALVIIQYYWITFAFNLEKQRFSITVSNSLEKVAKNLSRTRDVEVILKTISTPAPGNGGVIWTNNLNKVPYLKPGNNKSFTTFWKKSNSKKQFPNSLSVYSSQNKVTVISGDSILDCGLKKDSTLTLMLNIDDSDKFPVLSKPGKVYIKNKTNTFSKDKTDSFFTVFRKDSLEKDIISRGNKFTSFFTSGHNGIIINIDSIRAKKSEIIDTVISEILVDSKKKKITEQFPPAKIDSLLKSELKSKGIMSPFTFSIIQNDSTAFSNIKATVNDSSSVYKTSLTPDAYLINKTFLNVIFPGQDWYILGNMKTLLIFSLIIILVIIYLFYAAISMFLSQKKISEMKNDLINNISHEFKTPIASIALSSSVIAENVDVLPSEKIIKYSEVINDESKKLNRLVENLLESALHEKEIFNFRFEKNDIRCIIGESVKKYEVIETINFNLLYNSDRYEIVCDKLHIGNCIDNIIDNAVKYNTGNPVIEIKIQDYRKYLEISITDNGIGIAHNQLSKIFDTFYRVPTGNIHNVKGHGIGLSYTKNIIEAHQGSVKVKSKPGTGSTFIVRLPYEQN